MSTPLDWERWNVGCLAGFGVTSEGWDAAPTEDGTATSAAIAAIMMKRVSRWSGLIVIIIGTGTPELERLLAQPTLRRTLR